MKASHNFYSPVYPINNDQSLSIQLEGKTMMYKINYYVQRFWSKHLSKVELCSFLCIPNCEQIFRRNEMRNLSMNWLSMKLMEYGKYMNASPNFFIPVYTSEI